MRAAAGLAALGAVLILAACSEAPQELAGAKIDGGAPAWQGTEGQRDLAPGWTPSDAKAWDEQMRQRAQRGQNEYVRIGGAN